MTALQRIIRVTRESDRAVFIPEWSMDLGNTCRSKSGNLRSAASEAFRRICFAISATPVVCTFGTNALSFVPHEVSGVLRHGENVGLLLDFSPNPAPLRETAGIQPPAAASPVGAHRFVFQIPRASARKLLIAQTPEWAGVSLI
jgi:hypothetical protein